MSLVHTYPAPAPLSYADPTARVNGSGRVSCLIPNTLAVDIAPNVSAFDGGSINPDQSAHPHWRYVAFPIRETTNTCMLRIEVGTLNRASTE